jgi:hypothetical protein
LLQGWVSFEERTRTLDDRDDIEEGELSDGVVLVGVEGCERG